MEKEWEEWMGIGMGIIVVLHSKRIRLVPMHRKWDINSYSSDFIKAYSATVFADNLPINQRN